MSEEKILGCVEPGGGLTAPAESAPAPTAGVKEVKSMVLARVGKVAPDFTAPVFKGEGFAQVKLSDFRGKWVVVCFYPGDFTFV